MKGAKIALFSCAATLAAACMAYSASAADGGDVAIDETNFPDEIFRDYISENFDTDKNGSLSAEEIENASELSLSEPIYDEDGNLLRLELDLTGINHLKKLKLINVGLFNVKNADLSGIEALTDIGFSAGSVSGLVLGDVSNLNSCFINNSDLTELSLVDCPELVQCSFNSNKKLAKLEIKNAPGLMDIDCHENALVSFKLENCAMLNSINCSGNRLTRLDITNCPMISVLNCSGNMMTELDITPFKRLIENLKEYDASKDDAPLTVDSSTKVIGYDMTADESSESSESAAESTASSEPQERKNNSTMLIVILAVIVVAGIAAAVAVAKARGGKKHED